jgi:mannose-1-phosphate guanylyltransferase
MKAMILAAGKGTRVRPLTHKMPKPMIPVLGKPVMEYLVEQLARHSFDQIMVNVSHLAHSIENYFGDDGESRLVTRLRAIFRMAIRWLSQ